MLVRNHNQTLLRVARAFAAFGLLLALAAPVNAARVTDVRVGLHENFTRVVFETDTPTRYRIQRGPGGVIQVHLDASAMPRRITTRSKLMSEVRVGPGSQGATARLRLRGQNVKISELILLDPPRIVLDMRGTGTSAAVAKTTPTPQEKAAEAAAAKKLAEAAVAKKAAQAAEAKKLAEAAAAKKLAETAAAKKRAEAAAAKKLAETAAAKKLAESASAQTALAEAQAKAAEKARAGSEEPTATAAAAAEQARMLASGAAEKTTEAATEAATQPAKKAEQAAEAARAAARREAYQAGKAREKAADLARRAEPEVTPPASDASPLPAFLKDPVVLGGIGVAIALALGILVHQRRSGREDDYLSPTAADDEPFSLDEGASAAAAHEFEDSASTVAATPPLGAHDHEASHEDEEAAAVDTGTDTPIETTGYGAMPGSGPSADVMSMMQEMERRISGIEKRLEEVTEAKERLERQVAAQTEELRVQRSAIARTQRALRSIARPEDEATEPVPKT